MDAATVLRSARRAAGLTQAQLAARAGTTQPVVSAYENGRRDPTVGMLQRLVAATGATLELTCTAGDRIDVAANGRTIAELLDLADLLPQRHDHELRAPSFRSVVDDAARRR